MGILNNLFGKETAENANKNTSSIPDYITDTNWKELTQVSQLQEIKEASKTRKQVLFKHSTRCPISKNVLQQFSNQQKEQFEQNTDAYYLDLIAFRPVSNEIADLFSVEHASPQVIVLENEKVIAHNSHEGILTIEL